MTPSPAIGTAITGEGRVVFHDETVHGLHRLCVQAKDKYPDVETWLQMIGFRDGMKVRYTEKRTELVFYGYLWFYWKDER